MERFGYLVCHYPDQGGNFGFAVYENGYDRPFVRVVSGAHYGTEQTANLAGARVCERVRRVAERHGMELVAA
jgi:hypothetical protein